MAIRTRSTSRFQALKLTSMVACAFNPTTGKIHWQSRPGKEQFGDVVGRDIRDIWPDPQMVAGPVDRIGPTPAGMVRAIGWNLRLDRDAMLSVLERVEAADVLRPKAAGGISGAVAGMREQALVALLGVSLGNSPTIHKRVARCKRMLQRGRTAEQIASELEIESDQVVCLLARIAFRL